MNRILQTLLFTLVPILFSGCADNVKKYRVDPVIAHQIQSHNFKHIELTSVTMPQGDTNSVLCRMRSSISLPEKMKYSDYIRDALAKSLVIINDKKNPAESSHKLSVLLTKVDVNTLNAKWYIDANITIDNNKPIPLTTFTSHNFSYIADSACMNAASAFDEAVDSFIKQMFTYPEIATQLKS